MEITIRRAEVDSAADRSIIGALWREYLEWADRELASRYGLDMAAEFETTLEEAVVLDLERLLPRLAPPGGRALLAFAADGEPAGIGCLRSSTDTAAEIKRMYVRPTARGRGVGRRLFDELIEAARGAGYRTVRLDSARFMRAAHALYRSAGFKPIEPYEESEVPPHVWHYWLFMELEL